MDAAEWVPWDRGLLPPNLLVVGGGFRKCWRTLEEEEWAWLATSRRGRRRERWTYTGSTVNASSVGRSVGGSGRLLRSQPLLRSQLLRSQPPPRLRSQAVSSVGVLSSSSHEAAPERATVLLGVGWPQAVERRPDNRDGHSGAEGGGVHASRSAEKIRLWPGGPWVEARPVWWERQIEERYKQRGREGRAVYGWPVQVGRMGRRVGPTWRWPPVDGRRVVGWRARLVALGWRRWWLKRHWLGYRQWAGLKEVELGHQGFSVALYRRLWDQSRKYEAWCAAHRDGVTQHRVVLPGMRG
jgi:hypothetical protein